MELRTLATAIALSMCFVGCDDEASESSPGTGGSDGGADVGGGGDGGAGGAGGSGGSPAPNCNDGYADCNGDSEDYCEVHTDLDNANCGACGTTCATFCSGGQCLTAPEELAAAPCVESIRSDATHVYWQQCVAQPGIFRVPKAGGTVEQLVTAATRSFDVSNDAVYYNLSTSTCLVERRTLDGMTTETVHDGTAICQDVAVYNNTAHWLEYAGALHYHWTHSAGGSATAQASSSLPPPGAMQGLAVNQAGVFAIPNGGQNVIRVTSIGMEHVSQYSGDYDIVAIAPVSDWVYYLSENGVGNSIPYDEQSSSPSLTTPYVGEIKWLASDGDSPFIILRMDSESSSILLTKLPNYDLQALAELPLQAGPLSIDADAVYWYSGAGIMRLPR